MEKKTIHPNGHGDMQTGGPLASMHLHTHTYVYTHTHTFSPAVLAALSCASTQAMCACGADLGMSALSYLMFGCGHARMEVRGIHACVYARCKQRK